MKGLIAIFTLIFAVSAAYAEDKIQVLKESATPSILTPELKVASPGHKSSEAKQAELSSAKLPSPAFVLTRIGTVDMQRLGLESKAGKAGKKRFESKGEKLKQSIESKGKKLEKEKKALEAQMPSLSPEQRQAKAKEFDKKVEAYRKQLQKAQAEMEPLQKEISDKIFTLAEKASTAVGTEKGLSLIIPRREMLYKSVGSEVVDVTDDVIKKMDELQ